MIRLNCRIITLIQPDLVFTSASFFGDSDFCIRPTDCTVVALLARTVVYFMPFNWIGDSREITGNEGRELENDM